MLCSVSLRATAVVGRASLKGQGDMGMANAPISTYFNTTFYMLTKVIHPKYYKHLKKLLSTAIWADKNGLVLSKNLRSETI